MRPLRPWMLAAAYVLGALTFAPAPSLPTGWPDISWVWPIGQTAPFKTDTLAVLIVEETEQRTTEIDAIEGAVQKAVAAAGGKYRRLDKDQSDLSKDEPWVADAWKAKGDDVPWIVAANSRRGVTQHLTADSLKALSPLGVK